MEQTAPFPDATHIDFDAAFVAELADRGIAMAPPGPRLVHHQTLIEPPVSLHKLDLWAYPAEIGAFTYFGDGLFLNAKIGRYCSIGSGLTVGASQHPSDHLTSSPIPYIHFGDFQNFIQRARGPDWQRRLPEPYDFAKMRERTIIGNDVWIGVNVYIKDGIAIGDGAIIGAHAVVTRDVAPYTIVAGNPARVIRRRFPDQLTERLMRIRWWRYNIFDLIDVDTRNAPCALDRIEQLIADGSIETYDPEPVSIVEMYGNR